MKLLSAGRYVGYLLMCIGCFCCTPTTDNYNIIAKDIIDLGLVKLGHKLAFTIPLFNPTDHYLKILNVKGSCDCVTINTCPTGLNPGKSGTINATYDTKYERKAGSIDYKDVVIKLDEKPFIHSVKLKVTIQ